jgi:pteridine reductase
LALADQGFDVVVHYNRSEHAAQETAQGVRQRGCDAILARADLATPQGCEALIQRAGQVDVLVNSAAAYEELPLDQITAAHWDRMLALNTRAPFLLSQGLAPSLRRSTLEGGGMILNLADIGGERPTPGYTHYGVSKAGLIFLTQALALELAPQVRVNAISPGTVLVPVDLPPDRLKAIQDTIPLGRFGSSAAVVGAALYLLSAPYVTGQVLAVDGGRSVSGPMEAG